MSANDTAPAEISNNPFHTLLGLFTSPRKTFQHIAANPKPAVPFLLTMLLAIISTYLMQDRVLEMMIAAAENAAIDQGASEAAISQQVEFMNNYGVYMVWGMAMIMLPIAMVFHAAMMLFMSNVVFGGQAKFGGALAVSAWGYAAYSVIGLVITIPLMMITGSDYPLTGLGFLADGNPQAMQLYGSELELFSIAKVWLTGIGIAAVGRISEGKGLAVTGILFALFLGYNFLFI